MTSPADNLIVTAGDRRYAWGIYLLTASLRMHGMAQHVAIYLPGATPAIEAALDALGNLSFLHFTPETETALHARSLACAKPRLMLAALDAAPAARFVTWVDSDGFFTGDCSELLAPSDDAHIHIRMRSPQENCLAFHNHAFGEDGSRIPAAIQKIWRQDIQSALHVKPNTAPAILQDCSTCYLSLAAARRPFLEAWRDLIEAALPVGDAGVVNQHLPYYHQLDESVINALLAFWPHAPAVLPRFQLDRDPERCFVHFVNVPKPWQGWSPAAWRHYDRYLAVLDWALSRQLPLPGPIPWPLQRNRRWAARLLRYPLYFWTRLRRRLSR